MKSRFKNSDKTYIFIDESGKPEVFSAKGINLVETNQATRYLILAAVRHPDQLQLQQQVTDFRASLLKNHDLKEQFSSAYTLDAFHANNDYKTVRRHFYNFIKTLDITIDVLIVEKPQCNPVLQRNPDKLYGVMAGHLIKNLCHQSKATEVIFSRKDSKLKLRKELESQVERVRLEYMQQHPKLKKEVELKYFHNPHYTHGGLQIADYVAYALFQTFENMNKEYYKIIKSKIGSIYDICNRMSFTKRNPL
jgi:hypothetical protein